MIYIVVINVMIIMGIIAAMLDSKVVLIECEETDDEYETEYYIVYK